MGLFKKKLKQEHKIMLQHERAAGELLPEYHRATPECPHPERWSMVDSMTAEAEVLEFLLTLTTTIKPQLVVETGSFLGVSTLWIAKGLKANGFGKIISCEYDSVVFAKAQDKIASSGLAEWIELRNESSLEMKVEGQIDFFFSDSDMPIRAAEVKRFLPLVQDLEQRGETVPEDAIAAISPYLTEHINRFGDYTLNLAENRPSQTTATPSDGPPQPHETKWPILYRIVAIPPSAPNPLALYLTKLARLGGYLARAKDPPPGNTVMWRGITRLTDIQLGFLLGTQLVGN